MTPDEMMTAMRESGFQADALYPYIIVSLNNRPVNKIEVASAIVKHFDMSYKAIVKMLSHSGDTVLIKL